MAFKGFHVGFSVIIVRVTFSVAQRLRDSFDTFEWNQFHFFLLNGIFVRIEADVGIRCLGVYTIRVYGSIIWCYWTKM